MTRKLPLEAIFPEWEHPELEWYRLKKAGKLIVEHMGRMRVEIYNDVARDRRVTHKVEQLATKMRETWYVTDTLITFTSHGCVTEHEDN